MATGQQIVYNIMDDLPLDPIKARVALWKRLFRKSKGLGQFDIIDDDEFNLWLEAAKASKTDFPWARDLASLLLKQMGAAAWGRLDTELRKMAEGMTGADLLGFAIKALTTGEHAPGEDSREPLFEALAALAAAACDCPSPPKNVPESNRFAPSRVATRRSATFDPPLSPRRRVADRQQGRRDHRRVHDHGAGRRGPVAGGHEAPPRREGHRGADGVGRWPGAGRRRAAGQEDVRVRQGPARLLVQDKDVRHVQGGRPVLLSSPGGGA